MRIAIYGAGAIGGYLGAKLAGAGAEVSLIARGPHLAAMRDQGLSLIEEDGTRSTHKVKVAEDPRDLGEQDYVIITLKAPSVPSIAQPLQALLGKDTAVVTAQNGIPWWYFYAHGGPFDGRPLASVDPDGSLAKLIPGERCIGCVVYPAAELEAPGVVRHVYGNRFMLGEPDGSASPRCKALSKAMTQAGLKAPVRADIRDDIWLKLWGNLSFNPVSVLTHGTLEQIATDPDTRPIIAAMMAEAQSVAEALGVSFSVDIDTRMGWAQDVGAHRSSMLQDLDLGRRMEIEALIGVMVEMADLVKKDTPTIATVLGLLRQRARNAGCL